MADYIGRFVSPRTCLVPETYLIHTSEAMCNFAETWRNWTSVRGFAPLLRSSLAPAIRYVTKVGHKPRSAGHFSTRCADFDSPLEGVRPTIACNRNATLTGHCPDIFTERYVSLSRRESHLFVRDIFKISSRARGAFFLGRKLLQNSRETKTATFL